METKANYITVGAFVLGFIAFMAAFLIWVSGVSFTEKTKAMDIVFSKVSGLQEGSSVRYQGLHVGTVKGIRINPKNPAQILVHVIIEENVPIKTDVMATIESQGLTGTSYIHLTGGTEQAPNIKFSKKDTPQIIGKSSSLDNVLNNAPAVLNDFSTLAEDFRDVVNRENRQAFSDILQNIKDITDALKTSSKDGNIAESFAGLIVKFNKTLDEIENAAKEVRHTFSENRESIKAFTGAGLTMLTKFLNTAKDTLDTFKRVSEAIERSPTRFFHNDPDKGVRLK